MPKTKYQNFSFRADTLQTIAKANQIIAEYQAQGFDLTLRQLYYQMVSRDIIPNKVSEYKRLGSIINDARLAGLIDWLAIVDRTRNLRSVGHWDSPRDIIRSAYQSFRLDKWENQEYRPEVWIEKDALVGVIDGVCTEMDVPYFSCRGYTSQSEMWAAAQRLLRYADEGQTPVIIHLGDHDPSGKDMTRDIRERIELFTKQGIEVQRVALNMSQIEEYNPPPNPAKETDSRFRAYMLEFGDESWELDALDPTVIADVISSAITGFRNDTQWDEDVEREETQRRQLEGVSNHWTSVLKVVDKKLASNGK